MTNSAFIAVAIFLAAPAAANIAQAPPATQVVERAYDGDTISVQGVGMVHLLGVLAPKLDDVRPAIRETAHTAAEAVGLLTFNVKVRLEFEGEKQKPDDPPHAYVYLADGRLLNSELIRLGFAYASTDIPFSKLDAFLQLEQRAKAAKVGLWGKEPWTTEVTSSPEQGRHTTLAGAENIPGKCGAEWPGDFVMQRHCQEQQRKALAQLSARNMTASADHRTIRNKCKADWPVDFTMQNFCEEKQLKALAEIRR